MLRFLALATCTLIGLSACVVERPAPPPVERVVVRQAPPAEIVEVVPQHRPGHFWVAGHWVWEGNRYEWRPGHWEAERVGYRYVHPRWERHQDEWHFSAGAWIRE